MLGGLAVLTGVVSAWPGVAAIQERFRGAMRDGNVAAVTEAFNQTRAGPEALVAHQISQRRTVGASPD